MVILPILPLLMKIHLLQHVLHKMVGLVPAMRKQKEHGNGLMGQKVVLLSGSVPRVDQHRMVHMKTGQGVNQINQVMKTVRSFMQMEVDGMIYHVVEP